MIKLLCLTVLLKLSIKKNQYELCLIWKAVGEHLLTVIPKFCLEVCMSRNVFVKGGNILLCFKFMIQGKSVSVGGKSVSVGDTLPHTVFGVCGEFQRTGRFLQRGI